MKKSEEEENEKRSTELEFSCWPCSKPGWVLCAVLRSVSHRDLEADPAPHGWTPWNLLEPSLPSSNPALRIPAKRGEKCWQPGDRWCHNKILSLLTFLHCFCFSGQLPQKQIVLAVHMFVLCLLADPKEGLKTFLS